MRILSEFTNIMKKVNKMDKKFRRMYKENCFTSNPFSFTCGQTYAWVEDEKEKKDSEHKDS